MQVFGKNRAETIDASFLWIFNEMTRELLPCCQIKHNFTLKTDKVWMYEEIMTNDDNLESNLLTSILLKMHSLYKFCYKLHIQPEICVVSKLKYKWNVVGDLLPFILLTSVTDSIGYHSLHGSIMGCSLRVTRAGVAAWECEC